MFAIQLANRSTFLHNVISTDCFYLRIKFAFEIFLSKLEFSVYTIECMSIRNALIILFRYMGFFPYRFISKENSKRIIQILNPIDNGHELIRIGAEKDGGYLLPDDLNGVEVCFSPGVANNWSFEKDLFQKFNIASIMYDGSVSKPDDLTNEHTFYKKYIGSSSFKDFISISDVLNIDLKKFTGDLIAQVDIEGGEYSIFNTISESELLRFRIIVVEIHEIDRWIQKRYFDETIHLMLEKIFTTHDLVHSHPNNHGGYFRFKGYKFAKVVEITLHRKDRAKFYGGYREIPNILDADNV